MITEQEAREAAFRCLNGGDDTWCTSKDYYVSPKHEEDNDIVAKFVLDELSSREWQDEPSGDGWYWCEELDVDAPPQKIARHVIGVDAIGNDIQPTWKRWTVAGWVDIAGRVCKISERPA